MKAIKTKQPIIKIWAKDSLDEHAHIVVPESEDILKALLCDAMCQNEQLFSNILSCIAGISAFIDDSSWQKHKDFMERVRSNIKSQLP